MVCFQAIAFRRGILSPSIGDLRPSYCRGYLLQSVTFYGSGSLTPSAGYFNT